MAPRSTHAEPPIPTILRQMAVDGITTGTVGTTPVADRTAAATDVDGTE